MLQDKLRFELKERGVKLNDGVNARSKEDLFSQTGILVSDEVFYTLKQFDGFAEQDVGSYIEMWATERIGMMKNTDWGSSLLKGYSLVGDVLMDSDFIIADLSKPQEPVRLLYEGTIIGSSYSEFWRLLLSGKLDR